MKSKWWLFALGICILVAIFSPLASSAPDGLERVAENNGFLEMSSSSPFQIITGYVFPGMQNEALATIIAGIIGTLTLFGIVYGLAWLLILSSRKKSEPEKL